MSQLELSQISALHYTSPENEEDTEKKKLPYPKSVFFVIITELSERFSYYGMRAVLTIYMRNMLKFSENKATTLYHTFLLLCYGLPVVWGIISDSFLGKFKTIWIVSIFFAVGNIILSISAIQPLNLPAIPLTIVGLLFMAIGTGGMKPCVAPFGAEQFVLPQQAKYLQQFFSVFFFAVTVGNMISTVITPVFRRDVHCFGEDSCYPLSFGLPAIIMILAVGVFVSGKSLYKINKPEGNMLVKVIRCISHAIINKKTSEEAKPHWMDYADDKFDIGLINDIKMLLRVLIYYIPIPMFFALYEQLGSRWTLQATRMNGQLGIFTIVPDQMQVSNAIFMFIFIPIFQAVVYPLFAKCKLLKRPLQRMGVGGFIAALSFGVAGLVELQIEKNQYTPPTLSETHLNFVNTFPCPVFLTREFNSSVLTIDPEQSKLVNTVSVKEFLSVTLRLDETCKDAALMLKSNRKWVGRITLIAGSLQNVFVFSKNNSLFASTSGEKENFKKSNEGNAKIRIAFISSLNHSETFILKPAVDKAYNLNISRNGNSSNYYTDLIEVPPAEYEIINNDTRKEMGKVNLLPGGVYQLVIYPNYKNGNLKLQLVTINTPNDVNMLWLIPQYILMAWAEILFIVSGMEFSFTQSPNSMKSTLQSLWHLMNAFGNVIVIFSAQSTHVHSQATEFFEFSGAMFIDTVIFCLLAMRYKYVDVTVPTLPVKDRNDNKERHH